jgi:hypothetical protein
VGFFDFLDLKKEPESAVGVFEKLQKNFMWRIYNNSPRGMVKFADLKWFCDYLVNYELDCHICFAGQNGVGKSWSMLSFAKYLNPDFNIEKDFIYSFNTVADLIDKLMNYKNKVICVDEANMFFNYRSSQTKDNIALINAIEICRSRRNIVLTAVRDVRKLDLNYRNGKVSTLILLADRSIKTNRPYGMVFQGNWFIENDDKFMLDYLQYINTYASFRMQTEELPTFRGYLPIENHFTDKDIEHYSKFKEIQTSKAIAGLIKSTKKLTKEQKAELLQNIKNINELDTDDVKKLGDDIDEY